MTEIMLLIGAVFVFIAALGLWRMPDFYLRISSMTKASGMGGGLALLAIGWQHPDSVTLMRVIATIAFLFFTLPVAAHRMGRAAYIIGVPLWKNTTTDDLKGRYRDGEREPDPFPLTTRASQTKGSE